MSHGGFDTASLESAARHALHQGKLIIVASGNAGRGRETVGYPGSCPAVVAVAGVESTGDGTGRTEARDVATHGAEVALGAPAAPAPAPAQAIPVACDRIAGCARGVDAG
ncbi:S8 family serine peptidase [Embleya sp. NPDC059259]|uniref:S8 family serine peptidase n=1 Tax=unclassified Embleya TaxID=2699296 RepID=UPI0036AE199B